MNENLLKYTLLIIVFIGQATAVWYFTNEGTELISIKDALIIGLPCGLLYAVIWIKCPKLIVKNKYGEGLE